MKFESSAGGIVYKPVRRAQGKKSLKILVCQHSQHHGWVFPKGLIGDKDENKHQTQEQTAVREVKEETGIDAEIKKELKPVSYWYVWNEEKVKKTVYYFIMEFIGGDINDHDEEMEEVEWIDYNDVSSRLTYPSDKKVWEEARKLIASS